MERSRDLGVQLNAESLYLVRPDPDFAGEQADQPGEPDSGFVGVVVRGPRAGDSFGRLRADLQYLIADGPVVAADITPVLDVRPDFQPPEAHLSNLREVLNLTEDEDATAGALATLRQRRQNPLEEFARNNVALPLTLLDRLIEAARTQLSLLLSLREAQSASTHEQVTLQTATGPLQYTLPLSPEDTYGSTEVSEILSPTGKSHRTIAQNRRRANELLGVKIGNRYRYPKFQIDPTKHQIVPVVAHANRRLESDADPWGTLDWWFSQDEGLDGQRPIDLLRGHELSDEMVDFAIERSQQAMD
jgi:hypothetical protein